MFSSVDTIWTLVGAALVFFMQAGFAMVETGFTRAKNAGNIVMKNLMDFCYRHSRILDLGLRPDVRYRHRRVDRHTGLLCPGRIMHPGPTVPTLAFG